MSITHRQCNLIDMSLFSGLRLLHTDPVYPFYTSNPFYVCDLSVSTLVFDWDLSLKEKVLLVNGKIHT